MRFAEPTYIQDKMGNDQDGVDLAMLRAEVCDVLRRGANSKKPEKLSESVRNAIDWLET